MSSGRSEHSRDSSLERKSASPSARGSSKAGDSDHSEKNSTSRHSSRKKKKRKHHHHHHHRHQSKSPESLEHKHGKKEKKKHKSKKKHKRHHAHDESRPSKERDEEQLLSHQMEEDKQARDSVIVGNELEGGGDMEDKSHDTVMTGTETVVMEPELNFNTRDVPTNDVLVNSEPTVEQQGDHMTPPPPPPPVLVGVASPQPANQSATKE